MKAVTINNYPVAVKEYEGQRVVTFKDIDTVHGRADGTARRNFNTNKNHFLEGKDYYKIQPNEIRTVGIKSPNGGIVLTESGYLMLVKSLTDDTAWAVQRQLVETYFRARKQLPAKSEERQYEYFEKTYDGEPVVTIEDIAQATKMAISSVRYYVEMYLKKGVDYYNLGHEAVTAYKRENPRASKEISRVIVINRKGFIALMKAMGYKEKTKLFAPIVEDAKPMEKEYIHIADNQDFRMKVKQIKERLTTFNTLIDMVNKINIPRKDAESYAAVIQQCGQYIFMDADDVKCQISKMPITTKMKI